jgi:hypothetical protein
MDGMDGSRPEIAKGGSLRVEGRDLSNVVGSTRWTRILLDVERFSLPAAN